MGFFTRWRIENDRVCKEAIEKCIFMVYWTDLVALLMTALKGNRRSIRGEKRTDRRTDSKYRPIFGQRAGHVWTWIRDTMDQSTVYDASQSSVTAIDDLWFSLPPHLLFGDVAVELKAVIAVWPPLTLAVSSPPPLVQPPATRIAPKSIRVAWNLT